ncbi:MAG: DNA polymerase III subunit alpha [Candidatus Kapabacteria bacterium]|jgi:DNA polymerase-3 subunit alpha|nr:DNA polymerase III subunit alpha [Candidatus Kapabacteria bacterium]
MAEFVHLHNHTHYSLLDAACTPEQLIKAAKADGQKALAITDHGVMFGCFEFYKKAKKEGIKPIIGCEVYVAVQRHTDRERVTEQSGKKRNYYHLVLLAKNQEGYRNLIKLTSIAHTHGYYYKPRVDFDLLRQHSEGLIATSACLAGPINAPMLAGDTETAWKNARLLKEIYGDDFYIELQDHGLPEDRHVLEFAPKMAKELGIKLVVTNDVHYVDKTHAVPHNVLLSINKDTSSARNEHFDVTRDLRYKVEKFYLKTQQAMADEFKDYGNAVETSLEIAEKVNLTIPTDLQLPNFPIPPTSGAATLDDYLEELTMEGLSKRYTVMTADILDRASFELGVIRKMGYAGYFLIVQDFIAAARDRGIRVGPGRGSAAGSLVAFALGITNIDPIKYDLLFERFLNPDRVSMPDIDVDFADDKRELVIDYVKEKYGAEAVAQIITFGTLSSRAVLKDVGRVLGIELSLINSITDKIPVIMGKVTKIKDALELPDLRWLKETSDPRLKQLIEYSMVLEGFARNSSLHAAGVVIAPGPISDFVPVYKTPQTESATQYNMKDLEEAGLLKMDFLGLRTLSIIENTLELVKRNHGVEIDIDAIPLDDSKTFEMIGRGQTLAVFQFESEPMQNALRQLKPTVIEDLIAMNALYRPGPMDNIPDFIDRKHGRKQIEYLHSSMQGILEKTYGIIVYQEQVMQLVQVLAGFTLAQADLMRRAMGKKDEKLMAEQEALFVEGAKATSNIDPKLGREIFALIQKFAQYGFNKSHAAAYAYVAYQTGYLKANYPAEFLAANMTAELNDQAKIVALIDEAKRFGITVLPPDVNRSMAAFIAERGQIYFGMAGIKNVGVGVVEAIMRAREHAPFISFFDVASRVDARQLNRRVLEALVCSGAFDTLRHGHRSQLFAAIDTAMDYAKNVQGAGTVSMDSLFGGEAIKPTEPGLPPVAEWSERERLKREREYLSFYVSGHPLQEHALAVRSLSSLMLNKLEAITSGENVRLCGIVSDIRTRLDKRENTIAFVKVEQYFGACECVFWSDKYKQYVDILLPDAVLVFSGKCEIQGENVKIYIDDVSTLEAATKKLVKGYVVRLQPDLVEDDALAELRSRCGTADAMQSMTFVVPKTQGQVTYVSGVKVAVSDEMTSYLTQTFGDHNVRYAI